MLKRSVVVSAVFVAMCGLFSSSKAIAQSKDEGIRLHKEAYALQEKAQSHKDLKQAEQKFLQAIAIHRKVGDRKGAGLAYTSLGMIYSAWGQYDKAVEYYEKSLAICRELKDRMGESYTLNNLGNVYRNWGQYEKAVDYYEKSLAVARKFKDRKPQANALNNLGIVFWDWGQYDKAVDYYEKSLAIKRELKDRKGEGSTLNNLGIVYKAWGQHEKAVRYYEKGLQITRELKDRRTEGSTLNNLGSVYKDWGQYDRAVDYYEKSLAICRELKDRKGESAAMNNLGLVYKDWGQYDKAVEYYEKSLAIKRELKDRKGESYAIMGLGSVYKDWGQYEKAVDYYEKSLATSRELKDRIGESKAIMGLGSVYKDWRQYDRAVDYCEKSLAICRELKDRMGESAAINELGLVFWDWGQYDKAVEYYEKSLAICRELKNRMGESAAMNNLGLVNKDWGQYAKAVDYYEKSLPIFRKIGDVKAEGNALNNLGEVYWHWGQHAKAVEFFEKSLEIKRKIGDVAGEGWTLTNLGEVYRSRGEHDKALASFQKGLDIYVKIGVPVDRPKDLIGNLYLDKGEMEKAESFVKQSNNDSSLGRLYLVKANYPSAKNAYESLLKSAEQNRNADNLFTAYAGLGMSYEGMGDNAQAVGYYRKAVEQTEDLRSSLNPTERETFFDVRIGGFYRTAPYEGLARVLLKMNRPVEAFKESEYTRARIFAESISRRSEYAGLDVPKDIRDKDSQLTDELAALSKNLQKAYEKQNKEQIAVLEPQVKEAKQKLSAHVAMLRKQYPLFAATRYPQPMELDKTALHDNEWVLAYHVTDPGIIIYLTRGKNLLKGLFKPIPRKDVDELVRKYRQPMELGSEDSTKEKLTAFDFSSGKKLSDLLLADMLSDLPKDTPLIIIPDGSLGVVPFEMLVLNQDGMAQTDKTIPYVTGAEFLGDRNPISYYQAITALTLARTLGKQQKSGDRTLAMVDPVFSPDDVRLVQAATEKRRAMLDKLSSEKLMSFKTQLSLEIPRLPLTAQLGESLKKADPGKTDLYEGLTAQKAVLLQKDLQPYQSVVFATHGYFGKDLPGIQEPVLILTLPDQPEGQDGFLRMTEVMGLKMNADMVALTACQSGLGRIISGEGTMGMGRAFQYAGAKSVLMSLWSVAESSSVDLVTSFFKHLREGKNKLEALKLARDEIRKAGYDHPFFWAPFILVGEVD